jgi:hypothetical protein
VRLRAVDWREGEVDVSPVWHQIKATARSGNRF